MLGGGGVGGRGQLREKGFVFDGHVGMTTAHACEVARDNSKIAARNPFFLKAKNRKHEMYNFSQSKNYAINFLQWTN